MVDPRPIDGDNPYEKLGLDRTLEKSKIVPKAKKIRKKKSIELKQLHAARDNNDAYNRANKEFMEMDDAVEELERNHPEDGHPEPTDLSIELMTESPTVGESLTFRVEGDGDPERGVSVESEAGHSATTDPKGQVSFSFDSADTFELRAHGEFHHRPDTLEISVEPRTISLQIADYPSRLEVGEEGRVRVTDGQENGVESIPLLSGGDPIARTDGGGVATVSFDDIGPKEIEATATDTDDINYTPDAATINVTPTTIPLNLKYPKSGLETETEVNLKVVDDQDTGVKGVTVDVNEGPEGVTDQNGKAKLRFENPGPREVSVDKTVDDETVAYDGDEVTIPVGKGTVGLAIGDTEGDFTEGEKVRIQVVDGNGNAVQSATVSPDQGEDKMTDSDGWVKFKLGSQPVLTIDVSKESDRLEYDSLTTSFSVDEYRPTIEFSGMPNVTSPEASLDVRVVDENGNGINRAKITSAKQRGRTWKTDSDGYATIETMDKPGAEKFTADKQGREFEDIAEQNVLIQ